MFAEGDLEQFCNEYSSLDATMKKDIYESWELLHDTVQKYLKIYSFDTNFPIRIRGGRLPSNMVMQASDLEMVYDFLFYSKVLE